ncbi:hypothetical protein ACTFIY_001253 [Dictyostelium cf. discoideum]
MKTIKTIGSNFNLKELTDVFNFSFSDYVIKFVLTEESLSQKIQGDGISMDHSIGIYNENDENKLEGFILLAPNNFKNPTKLYNSATGVIPTARGNKLIEKSISQMKPIFKENGIKSIVLEVIQTNPRAIKVYENCGFKITRELHSYKGDLNRDSLLKYLNSNNENENDIIIEKVEKLTEDIINFIENDNQQQPLRMNPSWSNTNQVIQREFNMGFNKIWIAKDNKTNKIIGFLSIYSHSQRIRQVYVTPTYRNKNVATKLFYTMSNEFQSINFNASNIEEGYENLKNFFNKRIGLDFWVSQFEMELIL